MSEKSRQFLAAVDEHVSGLSKESIPREIMSIVNANEAWRRTECLNMICAENVMSENARRLMGTDFVLRIAEGFPGDRVHPPAEQAKYIDKIEGFIFALSKKLFRAKHVEWRPTSSTMANTVVFHSCLERGDLILSQAEDAGGNYSYHDVAAPGVLGLRVLNMPYCGDEFGIDLEGVRKVALRHRPRMMVIGGSNVLFPYPIREMREIADETGSMVLYDAAHVAIFIASHMFQDPLAEGGDIVTFSTHKSLGAPVGGMICTDDDELAGKISDCIHPTFLQSRNASDYCALAMTLAEHNAFGSAYAKQMVDNAKALGSELAANGFKVIGDQKGFTETHQIYLNTYSVEAAKRAEERCQAANILISVNYLVGDMTSGGRTGLRMTTQELTRLGMKEEEMKTVARLLKRLVLDRESVEKIKLEVRELVSSYPNVNYTFDTVLKL